MPSDWGAVFALETPLFELLARGTALYFGALVLVRLMPRRTGGELATIDLIFVLLIAEAAAHALGDYSSVADGILMIAVFMAWNSLVNLMSYHVPVIERLVSAPPLQVIRDGRMLRRNMRKEFVTEEELISHLREQGIDAVEKVKLATIEGDGRISVIQAGK